MTRGGVSSLITAAIVLCCVTLPVHASGRFLLEELDGLQTSGRALLQSSSSLNCTRINPVSGVRSSVFDRSTLRSERAG
jgi:hypothetical protein